MKYIKKNSYKLQNSEKKTPTLTTNAQSPKKNENLDEKNSPYKFSGVNILS